MKDKDQIKELFSDKLGNYEANINPALWENIASQVAGQSTAAVTGISLLTKLIIGALSAAVVTGLVVYSLSESPEKRKVENKQVQTSRVELIENETAIEQNLGDKEKVSKKKGLEARAEKQELLPNANEVNDLTPQTENNELIINNEPTVPVEKNQVIEVDKTKVVEKVIYPPKEGVEEPAKETEPAKEEPTTIIEAYSIEKMPNFFSPNNDGQNDIFFINSTGLSNFNLVVMDENNKTIFQTSNPGFKWNGTGMDSLPISKGRYVYFLTAKDENGNPVNKYSSLTVR